MSALNPFIAFPISDGGPDAGSKLLVSQDTAIKPVMDSWSSPPAGFVLLIQEAPDYSLLIDDEFLLLVG
jgi:hypothetical protein